MPVYEVAVRGPLLRSRAVPRLRRLLPVALAGLAVAGCGGGSATTTEPATVPTKTAPPPSTATNDFPPPPRKSSAPAGKDHGATPAGSQKRRREAEADFNKYCETHPGACGD